MTTVSLYEDNAGGLAIVIDGTDPVVGYGWNADEVEPNFADDAAALARGDTRHWTVDRLPGDWKPMAETHCVAEWHAATGAVELLRLPGASALQYLGLQPCEVCEEAPATTTTSGLRVCQDCHDTDPTIPTVAQAAITGATASTAIIGDPSQLYVCSDQAAEGVSIYDAEAWCGTHFAATCVVAGSTAPRVPVERETGTEVYGLFHAHAYLAARLPGPPNYHDDAAAACYAIVCEHDTAR